MQSPLTGRTAIAGIGATEFSKNSGRSEMRLAVEAITGALADAGIDVADVDGIATHTMDNNNDPDVFHAIGGRELKFFTRVAHGGAAACAPFLHAAMAVASGVPSTVVVYRALNERSKYRFGGGAAKQAAGVPDSRLLVASYHQMHGLRTPAATLAIVMRRYMQEYCATSEEFGRIAVTLRDYAATNPNAYFYVKLITLGGHQASRIVADPFRLLDCCQESDGAVAAVITSIEHTRDLRQPPVRILAAAQGASGDQSSGMTHYCGPETSQSCSRRGWWRANSTPWVSWRRRTSTWRSSTTTWPRPSCRSSKLLSSAGVAWPRTLSGTGTSGAVAGCPSTRMAARSGKRISMD